MDKYQMRNIMGVKFMGVEAALLTNPEKGLTDKLKIKYTDHPSDMSTSDFKFTSAWPRMNLR